MTAITPNDGGAVIDRCEVCGSDRPVSVNADDVRCCNEAPACYLTYASLYRQAIERRELA